jgi:leucyl/phenylalanyl-tRNA---protein transferase
MMRLHFIDPWDDQTPFPPPDAALIDPPGLLAAGGSLRPQRLLMAYRHGIFPWYSEGDPVLWWSPDPRCVIFPERIHVSRRLARRMRRNPFTITRDHAFAAVVDGCASPRAGDTGTWILPEMAAAYRRMHELGHATSFEIWDDDTLVGGIYGIHLGRVFFGESMFSRRSDASKIALVTAARADDIELIDCQLPTDHLHSMGAEPIPRARFLDLLREHGAARGGDHEGANGDR